MATFYLPSSGYYSTGQSTVRWRIKVTEDYSSANGKRLHCQVLASRTNSSAETDARGSVTFYLNDVEKSSISWALGDKPLKGTTEVVMGSCYVTIPNASTSAKITAEFSMPGINVGTQTNGGTVTLTKYNITYNANGGSGAPGTQSGCYRNSITLSSTKPTRTGYTFLGWGTSSTDTNVDFNPGDTYTISVAATLYAIWKINTYTVSYNANGGNDAPESQTKTHGTDLVISNVIPTRKGHKFLGWGTSATDTSEDYAPGANYIENASITLYAIWKKKNLMAINENGTIKKGRPWIDGKTGTPWINVNGTWQRGGS